jgi:hypothetical protein
MTLKALAQAVAENEKAQQRFTGREDGQTS